MEAPQQIFLLPQALLLLLISCVQTSQTAMAASRRAKALSVDSQTAKSLYTILKQLDLKPVNWNEVAASLDITNGHAARMSYSRFKSQIEGMRPQPATSNMKKEHPKQKHHQKPKRARDELEKCSLHGENWADVSKKAKFEASTFHPFEPQTLKWTTGGAEQHQNIPHAWLNPNQGLGDMNAICTDFPSQARNIRAIDQKHCEGDVEPSFTRLDSQLCPSWSIDEGDRSIEFAPHPLYCLDSTSNVWDSLRTAHFEVKQEPQDLQNPARRIASPQHTCWTDRIIPGTSESLLPSAYESQTPYIDKIENALPGKTNSPDHYVTATCGDVKYEPT